MALDRILGKPGTDPDRLTGDELVTHIRRLSSARAEHEAKAEAARQAVVDGFRSGRTRVPPVLQRVLADAAGITEGGVIAALKKDDERKARPSGTR